MTDERVTPRKRQWCLNAGGERDADLTIFCRPYKLIAPKWRCVVKAIRVLRTIQAVSGVGWRHRLSCWSISSIYALSSVSRIVKVKTPLFVGSFTRLRALSSKRVGISRSLVA